MNGTPIPEISTMNRWREGLRFLWDTSSNQAVATTRSWMDSELPRRYPVISSYPSNGGVSVTYAGIRDVLTYVVPFLEHQRVGQNDNTRRQERHLTWREIGTPNAVFDTDVIAIGGSSRRIRSLTRKRALVLPFRIHLVIPIDPSATDIQKRVSRKARQQFARQRHALMWKLERTNLQTDFLSFYDHFHMPTMRKRHGDSARSVGKGTAYRHLLKNGELFFVTQAGKRVAGMLCHRSADLLTLRLAGVLDGHSSHYQSGALMAVYMLIQEWATKNGVRQMDLSGCEPFLSKGVFQFKRKLHPEAALPKNHFGHKRLWIQVQHDRPLVRDFLVNNPMITEGEEDGSLVATYFRDANRTARLDLRWQAIGISQQRMIDLDEFFGQ